MATTYPRGLPRRYRRLWRKPWARRAPLVFGFRRWLQRHGYLSPHFTLAEAASKDGTPVPRRLLRAARNHAFRLERVRHALGDQPIPIISWHRSPAHNAAVGGASQSQHLKARATDHPREWVERVGRFRFDRVADRIFKDGGVGRYPAGSVHLDSRGWRARWTSF